MVISKNKNYELEKLKDKRKFEDATWLKKMLTTREGSLLGSFDSLRQCKNKFKKFLLTTLTSSLEEKL